MVSDAQIEGERVKANLAVSGSEWMNDWRLDVRAPFKIDDGETILMHYTGLVEQTRRLSRRRRLIATDWGDQYMRLAMSFDTSAKKYRWLNTSLFIARRQLLGTRHIEYEVCPVV